MEHLDLIRQFVQDLQIEGCCVQAGTKNWVIAILTPNLWDYFTNRHTKRDIHFLGGVDPRHGWRRAGNKEVIWKNYFFLDFDIRVFWMETYKEEISDWLIKEIAEGIIFVFATDPLLKQWRYLVFTGNGIHIYYFFPAIKVTSERFWKRGMQRLLREHVGRLLELPPDKSCTNISKLGRLPLTYNNKQERRIPVEIIGFQDCFFLPPSL
ncbi:hypothetical protein HYS30_01200 [Candidatus Peregrinibacteria bacterium]|nr:hypothetical protein [Candidatus Peregrinibacteria bacterium]